MPCLLRLNRYSTSHNFLTFVFNRKLTDDEARAFHELIERKLNPQSEISPALDNAIGEFIADKPPSIMKE